MSDDDRVNRVVTTCKRAAAALRDAGVPFAVGGGLACWARGGPLADSDVDLMLAEADLPRALAALEGAGMEHVEPPEEWLTKAIDGDVTVDLIHHPSGIVVTAEVLARAEELPVLAVTMPVLPLEDVFVTQLLSLCERHLPYSTLIEGLGLVQFA